MSFIQTLKEYIIAPSRLGRALKDNRLARRHLKCAIRNAEGLKGSLDDLIEGVSGEDGKLS